MKMLIQVKLPTEKFNMYVKDNSIGQKVKKILDEIKPEVVYFTEYCGMRGAVMIVNLTSESDVPKIAEPWFLMFDAKVSFHAVMTPEELEKAGLSGLGKKWA